MSQIVPLAEPGLAKHGIVSHDAHGKVRATVYWDGLPFVYGVPPKIKPLVGVPPEAHLRFRFRDGYEGLVYLRTSAGAQCWTLDDHGDHWELGTCRGRNVRARA